MKRSKINQEIKWARKLLDKKGLDKKGHRRLYFG
jgi:hypothetical protein